MIDFTDAVNELRTQVLMDTDAGNFRWNNALLVRIGNLTVSEMLRVRPILKFDAPNSYLPDEKFVIPSGALGGETAFKIPIPSRYLEAFINGMAARCFTPAIGTPDTARMNYHTQRFMELMNQ